MQVFVYFFYVKKFTWKDLHYIIDFENQLLKMLLFWMNFLKFLYITALSLRNFIMKFKWLMQRTSVFLLLFFFFITENYGYCVKKNFHTILHSRFYILLYYVVSYSICAVIFSQLCVSTILLHSTYTHVIL